MQQNQVIQHRISGWEYEMPTVYACVHTHTHVPLFLVPPLANSPPQGNVDKHFNGVVRVEGMSSYFLPSLTFPEEIIGAIYR